MRTFEKTKETLANQIGESKRQFDVIGKGGQLYDV